MELKNSKDLKMSNIPTLYDKVVNISEEFLGPAGERFIRRQIETHLEIVPENIQVKHLSKLVDWTRLTFTMVTSDSRVVNDFASKLSDLVNSGSKKVASTTSIKN